MEEEEERRRGGEVEEEKEERIRGGEVEEEEEEEKAENNELKKQRLVSRIRRKYVIPMQRFTAEPNICKHHFLAQ